MTAGSKIRVLVVDDEEGAREGLRKLLKLDGYDVTLAEDGVAAMEKVAERPPDVVVTDLKMPRMDGFGLMAKLKELYPEMPVIVVTAFGDVTSAVNAMRKGAEHYLVKPVDVDRLNAILARVPGARELKNEIGQLREELGRLGRFDGRRRRS